MKAEIVFQPTGVGGSLLLDGHNVANAVKGFTLIANAGDMPQLMLHALLHERSTADGEADVTVPPATVALLVRLGWTPPDAPPPPQDAAPALTRPPG